MRFTLPKLFLVVTLAALACGGMMARTRGWADSIVTLTFAMFAIVGLMALASGGQTRVFRATFALAGTSYMLIVLCSLFTPIRDSLLTSRVLILAANALQVPTYIAVPVQPTMPTPYYAPATASTAYPAPMPALPATPAATPAPASGTLTLSGGNSYYGQTVTTYVTAGPYSAYDPMESVLSQNYLTLNYAIPAVSFLIIGHCVWAWLLALLAGGFASMMYSKFQRSTAHEQPQPGAA